MSIPLPKSDTDTPTVELLQHDSFDTVVNVLNAEGDVVPEDIVDLENRAVNALSVDPFALYESEVESYLAQEEYEALMVKFRKERDAYDDRVEVGRQNGTLTWEQAEAILLQSGVKPPVEPVKPSLKRMGTTAIDSVK